MQPWSDFSQAPPPLSARIQTRLRTSVSGAQLTVYTGYVDLLCKNHTAPLGWAEIVFGLANTYEPRVIGSIVLFGEENMITETFHFWSSWLGWSDLLFFANF